MLYNILTIFWFDNPEMLHKFVFRKIKRGLFLQLKIYNNLNINLNLQIKNQKIKVKFNNLPIICIFILHFFTLILIMFYLCFTIDFTNQKIQF
jgi:hypothetical protein